MVNKPSMRHRIRSLRRRSTALAALVALGVPLLSHAAAQAHLDRTATAPDQAFTLSITSDGAARGAQPDLAPLNANFQVLGTSSGSQTTIVNGQRSDQLRWSIRLQPKHAGRIEIPPIAVGTDHTQALEVNVAQASPAERAADEQHAFVEVDAGAASLSPYVQQQVPYTVRLFFDDSVTPTQLEVPAPENAVVEQLGADKRYTAVRHGHEFNVIERDYAIAPEKSGTLVIPPPQFHGNEAVAGGPTENADPQDDVFARMLANTPFAHMPGLRAGFGPGSPFGQETRPISGTGLPVTLNVKPRPAGVQGDWLPAAQIDLQDGWASGVPAFKVGEPVTRVITIQAKGLAASQIPTLPVASLANARVYAEAPDNQSQTDGQAIYGISKQSVTYIPTQAGTLDIPAIDLTWWDVGSNVQRHTRLPAFQVQVTPGIAGAPAGGTLPVAAAPNRTPQARGAAERLHGLVGNAGTALAGLLLFGMLVAALAYAMRRRRVASQPTPGRADETAPAPRKATTLRALREACTTHSAAKAAQALLDLARLEWPNDPPRGLEALAARIDSGAQEVLHLDRFLYGSGEPAWNSIALWQAVRGGLRPKQSTSRPEPAGLDPLYPKWAP